MPCYHPLKGFIIGETTKGKPKIKVTSYNVHHLERKGEGSQWICVPDEKEIYPDVLYPAFDIPCGHCIGCRLAYSRDWAARCVLEQKQHNSSYFITLTYDDLHLVWSASVDEDTGEILGTPTLVKRDFQLFMKRLRKKYEKKYKGSKLRFFAAGEYGDKSFRPHYHAIIFGLVLDDLVPYKGSGSFRLYTSDWLQELWPNGMVVVGEATFETAAYVARYVCKKVNGSEKEKYDKLGIIPEFSLMSRKPGIAAYYVDENIEHLLDDLYISVSTATGGKKFPAPKYFKRKYDAFFEQQDMLRYSCIQDQMSEASRRQLESIKQQKSGMTSLSYLDLLAVQEAAQVAKLKGLERSL